ncbi:hypothetical protein MJO29_000566 [Puccinia striiformis f. sp. tritici]|uniref:Uncharacterized protein n=1 Tax=Puccinia striiformis TaxID=27350 RepID=A0A2S4UJL2_9BASI|nr:hypothetical protein MJO29_000566 [Puccinia striiformis f. sp. tritici]POV97498.1 hypothetical protein PSTT_15018 [Puccinia striiformis]
MLPTLSFGRAYMALTAITSILFSSSQVAAADDTKTVRCGTGFEPTRENPAYYRCLDDSQVLSICKEDSCWEGGYRWKDFTFSGCDQWGELAPTGKVDQSFYVEHFVADNTARTKPTVSMVFIITALLTNLQILTHAGRLVQIAKPLKNTYQAWSKDEDLWETTRA